MSELKPTIEAAQAGEEQKFEKSSAAGKPWWETPKLEDVSEQVMAQPYIRFTRNNASFRNVGAFARRVPGAPFSCLAADQPLRRAMYRVLRGVRARPCLVG